MMFAIVVGDHHIGRYVVQRVLDAQRLGGDTLGLGDIKPELGLHRLESFHHLADLVLAFDLDGAVEIALGDLAEVADGGVERAHDRADQCDARPPSQHDARRDHRDRTIAQHGVAALCCRVFLLGHVELQVAQLIDPFAYRHK